MLTLKALRIKASQTQADVARAIGVDRTTYAKYETGASEPSIEMLQRMAKHFNISISGILGEMDGSEGSSYIRIPVLGRVAAGIPIDAIEEIIDYEDIPAEMVSGGAEYFGLQIKGDSMEPKISNGDIVIVRKQPDVESGEVAVVLVNGNDATVKRVKKSAAGITLIANNPVYDPKFYSNEDIEKMPISILGRVVELRAKI